MRRFTCCAALVALLGLATNAAALTIDLTYNVDLASNPDQAVYTVGLLDDAGAPTSINGYTIDFTFDGAELALVSVEQLLTASSGAFRPDFLNAAACQAGRCTAGNIPGLDSDPLGALFAVTFDILPGAVRDGLADFTAGLLDPVFDGITGPAGDLMVDARIASVSHTEIVPEPSTLLLLAGGLAGLAAPGRRTRG